MQCKRASIVYSLFYRLLSHTKILYKVQAWGSKDIRLMVVGWEELGAFCRQIRDSFSFFDYGKFMHVLELSFV